MSDLLSEVVVCEQNCSLSSQIISQCIIWGYLVVETQNSWLPLPWWKKNMSILVLFNVTDTRHAVGNIWNPSERQLPNYQFCVVIMISSRRTKHSYQHGKPHGIFHLGGQVPSYTNTECHGARLFELKAVQSGLSRHWPWVSIHLDEVVLRV